MAHLVETMAYANKLLGHSSIQMTEDYIKQRKTDVAEPLSRRKK